MSTQLLPIESLGSNGELFLDICCKVTYFLLELFPELAFEGERKFLRGKGKSEAVST